MPQRESMSNILIKQKTQSCIPSIKCSLAKTASQRGSLLISHLPGPSRKESGGLSPSFIRLQKHISSKDWMFSWWGKTLTEVRAAALNFPQSWFLSRYAWGFTCQQFQRLLPKSHLPSPFLSNLFWVYFLTVPLFNFLEGRASLRSSRIVSLTYLDEDHPRFTDPRMNFSLYNNSTENKEASLVKMSSEMSPWLSVPRVSHRENAAWREALLNWKKSVCFM